MKAAEYLKENGYYDNRVWNDNEVSEMMQEYSDHVIESTPDTPHECENFNELVRRHPESKTLINRIRVKYAEQRRISTMIRECRDPFK